MADPIHRCPWCGYLLYDCALPRRCSECGANLVDRYFENPLPWEAHGGRLSARRFLATVLMFVASPRESLNRLRNRADCGILGSGRLTLCLLGAYALVALAASVSLHVLACVLRTIYYGGPLFENLAFQFPLRDIVWGTRFFRSDCVPWLIVWAIGSGIVWMVAPTHRGIHTLRSTLAALGPLPLLGATAGCTISLLQLLLSPETIPPMPLIRWAGARALLVLFVIFSVQFARIAPPVHADDAK